MSWVTLLGVGARWWKLALGLILGALMCYPLAECQGEHAGKAKAKAEFTIALQRANNVALEQKARADTLASQERLKDTVTIIERKKVRDNVITNAKNSAPDDPHAQLGCQRLREAPGFDKARLPAQCRPNG